MSDATTPQETPAAPEAAPKELTVTLTVKYLASIMADQHLKGMEAGFAKIGQALTQSSQKAMLPNQGAVSEAIYADLMAQLETAKNAPAAPASEAPKTQ